MNCPSTGTNRWKCLPPPLFHKLCRDRNIDSGLCGQPRSRVGMTLSSRSFAARRRSHELTAADDYSSVSWKKAWRSVPSRPGPRPMRVVIIAKLSASRAASIFMCDRSSCSRDGPLRRPLDDQCVSVGQQPNLLVLRPASLGDATVAEVGCSETTESKRQRERNLTGVKDVAAVGDGNRRRIQWSVIKSPNAI